MSLPLPKALFEGQSEPSYALQRHHAASSRLNLQHNQMQKAIGYMLHPSIPINPGMKIGEIASGTGIWLLDLYDDVPKDCILEGWDISGAQFPSSELLPDNTKLGIWDATSEVPEHLIERYDVVHVSIVVCAVYGGDPGPWIENVKKTISNLYYGYVNQVRQLT
jgi:hypothetical protein